MAVDDVIVRAGPVAVPLDYKVPTGTELIPRSISANINGANAASAFVPVLEVIAPSGAVTAYCARRVEIAAGASVLASWFPGVAEADDTATAAGIGSVRSTAGTLTVNNPTGPTVGIDLPVTGVTAGNYGDAADSAQVTVDAQGRITAATSVPIAGGGAVVASDGWVPDTTETWTYASGSGGGTATFTVPGDLRAKYTVGTRIRLVQTTTKYFVVSLDPTYDGVNTTVTITAGTDYTLANAAISANYHSYVANPQGYPGWFTFTSTVTGFASTTSKLIKFAVEGRICFIYVDIDGTSNANGLTFTAPIATQNPDGSTQLSLLSVLDNGVANLNPGLINIPAAGSAVFTISKDIGGASFANTGHKRAIGSAFYQI